MSNDDRGSRSSDYVEWKGWVDQTPFGHLPAGESAYYDNELRAVHVAPGVIRDVLEIGYGNGAFLSYCRERGWAVTGTELEPGLVQAGLDAGFAVFASDRMDKIADQSFDLIAVFDVLEHIPPPAVPEFLLGLSRKLREGGKIIFRFPNADSWLGNALQNGDPTHCNAIGYLKMTFFALQAGLEVVKFRGARRHGFATSFANGMYALIAGPIIAVTSAVLRALYFPGLPVVLSTSNVVCIVANRNSPMPGRTDSEASA
ncbi:MAG: class I SAM-dependent methyltransferase [Candidatus Saccharibacteria bacterium]|nr:class I SAM-dependent methyltransferase [Microbacteriaceae bacterium]